MVVIFLSGESTSCGKIGRCSTLTTDLPFRKDLRYYTSLNATRGYDDKSANLNRKIPEAPVSERPKAPKPFDPKLSFPNNVFFFLSFLNYCSI